uniref:(California timema) hypothetical protein n=1 Tax=Timema californicum TaxID=61474 RepID=A0A7R9P7F0_TIMCA|nr:unnamed protein product [Timema californicum]
MRGLLLKDHLSLAEVRIATGNMTFRLGLDENGERQDGVENWGMLSRNTKSSLDKWAIRRAEGAGYMGGESKKARVQRYNQRQVFELLEHLSSHSEFAAGRFSGPLRSIGLEQEWEKVWRDLKTRTRARVAELAKARSATGNKDKPPPLNEIEQKVVAIIGTGTSTGVEGIQEIGFGEDSFLCFEVSAEESVEMDQMNPLLLNSESVVVEETAYSPIGVSHEIAVETPLRKRKRTTGSEENRGHSNITEYCCFDEMDTTLELTELVAIRVTPETDSMLVPSYTGRNINQTEKKEVNSEEINNTDQSFSKSYESATTSSFCKADAEPSTTCAIYESKTVGSTKLNLRRIPNQNIVYASNESDVDFSGEDSDEY